MYFHTLAQMISTISLVLACGFGFWRGGRVEKITAALFLIDWGATPILQHFSDRSHFELNVFVVDSLVLFILLYMAFTGNRFWTLWAAAFQFLELLIHIGMLIDHNVRPRAYFVGQEIVSYLILAALAVGTWLEAPRVGNELNAP